MNNETLQSIINRKNERREQQCLDRAAGIIDEISNCQARVEQENAKIKELRAELVTLEVVTIDPAAILGS